MFESEGKLELDCALVEGANGATADCSGSPASTRTSSIDETTDGASIFPLVVLSSDDAARSTVGADSARIGSVDVEATTGAGAA